MLLRGDRKKVDLRYLYHWFSSPKIQQLARSFGKQTTSISNLNQNRCLDLKIPLPPLDEQKRIAAILDKADELRAKRRKAIALLDSLTQSIFLEMFGDPEQNPFNLPVVELGSLIKSGPTNGLYKPASAYGDGTKILRINNFYHGSIVDLDSLRRLHVSEKEQQAYALKEGDIVINRVNSREYLGKSALVPPLTEPMVFESNMMRMSLKEDFIAPRYCIDFLQSAFIKRQIARMAKDAVNQSSINQSDVRSLNILLPSLAKQIEYANLVVAGAKTLKRLDTLRVQDGRLAASLQHRAFSSQL